MQQVLIWYLQSLHTQCNQSFSNCPPQELHVAVAMPMIGALHPWLINPKTELTGICITNDLLFVFAARPIQSSPVWNVS